MGLMLFVVAIFPTILTGQLLVRALKDLDVAEAERDKYKQLLEFSNGKLPNVIYGDARNYFSDKKHDSLKVNTLYEDIEEIKDNQHRLDIVHETLRDEINQKDKWIKALIRENWELRKNNNDIMIIDKDTKIVEAELVNSYGVVVEKQVLYVRGDEE